MENETAGAGFSRANRSPYTYDRTPFRNLLTYMRRRRDFFFKNKELALGRGKNRQDVIDPQSF